VVKIPIRENQSFWEKITLNWVKMKIKMKQPERRVILGFYNMVAITEQTAELDHIMSMLQTEAEIGAV
jgi:hypothetical protein